MKRNEEDKSKRKNEEETSVHVSSSAVDSGSRTLSAIPATARVTSSSSPPPTQLANIILTGDLRSATNRSLEPSIAASMASFSAATSFVGAANGSVLTTSSASFNAQNSKITNNGGGATVQVGAHQQHIFHQSLAQQQVRHSLATASIPACSPPAPAQSTAQPSHQQQNIQAFPINAGQHGPGAQQFQRLKVEDALSYLDQVKYKFGNQPQVYNDFLDIMKEFKSQSIDTPGVIARVSSLFRGHPELIVGFNTFLPPGYKIEVQAEQVSVSVPGSMGVPAHIHHITHGPVPPTSSTITQQLEVVARSTPPVQHVSVTAATAAPQLQQQSSLPASSGAPPISAVSQQTTTVKEEIPLAPAGGALTVKPAVSSPIAHAASVSSGGPSFGLGSLHKESASSPQLGSAAHGYANSSSQGAAAAFGVPNASQPVEFNHAINYVNKIKNRFQGQPDIYKQFLEILHTYQKEQRSLKEGLVNPINYRPTLTEAEVYAKVAQLFQNQEDLLQEFGQFLPDATNVSRSGSSITSCGGVGASGGSGGGGNGGSGLLPVSVPNSSSVPSKKSNPVTENTSVKSTPVAPANSGSGSGSTGTGQTGLSAAAKVPLKRAAPATSAALPSSSPSGGSLGMGGSNQGSSIIPNKKPRLNSSKDYSIADVGKYGTMNELAFFDKVRRVACRSREVYDNFLRCLVMYNQEIISKMELLQITTPFLSRHPDLLKWFKDFLGLKETNMETHVDAQPISLFRSRIEREMLTSKDGKDSRDREREALEIDYSTCKRLGTSYCALPKSYEAPKCSGRTPLCKEVLNETWVSFPSWSSEDSTFVSSRKTQYEEYIYRTEDERYELDIVLETHMSTIRVLEGVMKKLNRMNPDEAARFKLDDCLGGSSPTIHIRAIRRIYGDKASEIIEGLKRSPMVAIPVVLRRMKAKEEEWREAQKGFNKIWRDQNEKYYLKSLDHLGTNFKQNDVKALRSKALINEIETICEERNEENAQGKNDRSPTDSASGGPHMKFVYKSRHKVLDDAADLLIHHAKRQTNITKEDKRRIKTLLRQTIPDMFRHPRQELSEDEREDDDDDDAGNKKETGKSSETTSTPAAEDGRKSQRRSGKLVINGRGGDGGESREGNSTAGDDEDEEYSVFFANNLWYVFLRLHHILCERLSKVWDRANQLLEEEKEEAAKTQRHSRVNGRSNENVAVALRLKPKAEVEVDQYYPHFLSMVKNLLDGNVEASSYEDSLREMFGIHAYLVFTLDKVIANAVRQLGHLVADDVCIQCTDIFLEEHGLKFSGHKLKGHDDRSENDPSSKKSSVGGDMSYQRRMEQILTEENLYRIVLWHKEEECTVTVELMDTDTHSSCSGENPPIQDVQNWSNYVERYVSDRVDEGSEKARRKNDPGGGGLKVKKPVFLQRNLKQWERRRRKDVGSSGGSKPDSRSQSASGDVKMDVDMKDVAAREDAHCVFNVNSYQMVFVANSESFLYKRHAFTRAKQCHRSVTLRMRKHFLAWQQQWASTNVTTEAESQCFNWLLGKGDNLELKTNSKTVRVPTNVEHRAPFGTLVKYRVEYDS